MAGNAAARKSFELRMSKKVAELTQVVHMLFMKHHEKELEAEALRDAYEHEIDIVIADARGQLEELTRQLEETERRLKAKAENQLENEADQQKMEALEKSLQAEKAESQSLRDRLILSHKDFEELRLLSAQELANHSSEMSEKSKEIDLLRLHVTDLERISRYSESETARLVDSLRATVDKLHGEATALREELEGSERLRESLTNRNKNLEDDVRRLKRELAKRSSLPEVDNAKQETVGVNTETYSRRPNYDRELHRLKQEIQRYRMELSNRETNYNRRFADMQPIIVDRRPISARTSAAVIDGHSSQNAGAPNGHHGNLNGHHGNLSRSGAYAGPERTLAERELREITHHSDDLISSSASASPSVIRPSSSVNSSERLPRLDDRMSLRRPVLDKPQPSKFLISRRSHRTKSYV